ncbi:SAF domain-containing protein [Streptomyces sp. NPDC020719]|uniref:SAF domain-containing protein n=1 Tax=Streptomyces sp. NPDC020719 TaxID=3154896 RepID=UPI00340BD5F3
MGTRVRPREAPGQEAVRRAGRRNAGAPVRVVGVRRPRRVPYLLVGVLLVLGCTTGAVLLALHLGDRETVLVLARPVFAGQQLDARDLREVTLSKDSGVDAVPARSRASLEGRPVAYALPAGALLTESVLGSPKVPSAGQAVAAVGLKDGQFPAGLQPGSRVAVVTAAENGGAAAASGSASWRATVTDIRSVRDDRTTVVTLQLGEGDARGLAAAAEGRIRLVVVHGGEGL